MRKQHQDVQMDRQNFSRAALSTAGVDVILAPDIKKFLLSIELTGSQLNSGEQVLSQLQQGQALQFMSETTDCCGESTLTVYRQDNQPGYIPQRSESVIAQIMDQDDSLQRQVERLQVVANLWDRVRLEGGESSGK